jgi:hypothetical protein
VVIWWCGGHDARHVVGEVSCPRRALVNSRVRATSGIRKLLNADAFCGVVVRVRR